MHQSASAAPEFYPKPIGVLTATLIGYRPDNPEEIVFIELQSPEVANKNTVLPGGIYNLGQGKHRSQRSVVDAETLEETGLQFAPGHKPIHFAISQRLDVDPRRWCSFPTINGANDYIMACPLVGEINPQDTNEVRRAFWRDISEINLEVIGRGHDLLVKLWQRICACGGLHEGLFSEANRARIRALSDDRHAVSIGELNRMIYLEDTTAILDERT